MRSSVNAIITNSFCRADSQPHAVGPPFYGVLPITPRTAAATKAMPKEGRCANAHGAPG